MPLPIGYNILQTMVPNAVDLSMVRSNNTLKTPMDYVIDEDNKLHFVEWVFDESKKGTNFRPTNRILVSDIDKTDNIADILLIKKAGDKDANS